MNSIGIMTDSHSGISQKEAEQLGIKILPMPFYLNDVCYYEDKTITREEFFRRMAEDENVGTSQPAPGDVMDMWKEMLNTYESVVYIPISSGLSGSCDTAKMLAQEEEFEGKVFVVDNGRVATPLHQSVLDAIQLIEEGYTAAQIRDILEASREKTVIYVAVDTLEYLKRGGRINAATASIGTLLNIKPILKFDVGKLDAFKKCRGFKKAKSEMLQAMKHEFETTFKEEFERGEVNLVAASSADEETTNTWVEEIKAFFPDMEVMCDPISLGVSCHTGPGALGIGCSCRPKRIDQ